LLEKCCFRRVLFYTLFHVIIAENVTNYWKLKRMGSDENDL